MRKSKPSASISLSTAKRVTTARSIKSINQNQIASAVPVCLSEPRLAQRRVQATNGNKEKTKQHGQPQAGLGAGQEAGRQDGGREVRRYLRHLATLHPADQRTVRTLLQRKPGLRRLFDPRLAIDRSQRHVGQ